MADATKHGPDGEQAVIVPWEWLGPPGGETSAPIFGRMHVPSAPGGPGAGTRRQLGLPAPGEVVFYRFDVPEACVAWLTYRFRGGEASQLVPLVAGFNVVELRREDDPT